MSNAATIVVYLAFAGALASWIVGAVYFARTLSAISGDKGMLLFAMVAWPFAVSKLKGESAAHAAKVNKALVAFMACVVVAIAAFSVAANLQRIAR